MSDNVTNKPEKIIKGRYVIGNPAGTFDETPRLARQPGKISHRSDWIADISRVGDVLVMGASLRGAMHYGLSTIRQDSFAIGTTESEDENNPKWIISVISDGVSSATQSHTFADYMVRQTVIAVGDELNTCNPKSLRDIDWSKIACQLVDISAEFCRNAAKRTVSEDKTAEVSKASPRDFAKKWATTLEFSVTQANCGDIHDKREFVHVTVAGDGAAYVLNKKQGWQTVKTGKSQTGAIASNAVLSLPLEPKEFIVNHGHLEKTDCLILATDGLGDFIGDGNTPLGDFFKRKLPICESLVAFLQIVDVSLYQADDDRTIIMIKEV
jgi:serine/threonine protein phosphatase PrpC